MYSCFFDGPCPYCSLHSSPTRRSSDLRNSSRRRPWPTRRRTTSAAEATLSIATWETSGDRQRRLSGRRGPRSEEHTSELQSRGHLVCRLLLEKNNKK